MWLTPPSTKRNVAYDCHLGSIMTAVIRTGPARRLGGPVSQESSVAQQVVHVGPAARPGGAPIRPGGPAARPGATVVSVALARLVVKRSIREGGVNQEHVRRL